MEYMNYDIQQKQTVHINLHLMIKKYQLDMNISLNVYRMKVPKI